MFNPQLALHMYKEEAKKKNTLGRDAYMVFEKYDGWYGSMLLLPHQCTSEPFMLSRQGRAVPSVNWLASEINERLMSLPPVARVHGRLVFEILLRDVKEFSELNGILNRSKGDCAAKEAYIMVHDFIPYGGENLPFSHRYELAKDLVNLLQLERVDYADYIMVSPSKATWQRCAQHIWERGGEGVILKRMNAPYQEGKRNADILKIKLEDPFDLLVVGVEKGDPDGKYFNALGALMCVSKDGTVHRISGMTDDQRYAWWHTPSTIVGKVVEVRAMCKLANGSLREPRFKSIRFDKTAEDID